VNAWFDDAMTGSRSPIIGMVPPAGGATSIDPLPWSHRTPAGRRGCGALDSLALWLGEDP